MPSPQKNYQGGGITLEVSDVTFMCRCGVRGYFLILKVILNGGVMLYM